MSTSWHLGYGGAQFTKAPVLMELVGGGADNKHKNKIHLDSVSHRKKIKGGK